MFKSERFLPNLFDVLLRLDPRPAEIVLLDDASPDDSFGQAREFANSAPFPVTLLRNEANSGIAAAYNRLAMSMSERWIHILDADDHPVEPDYYARVALRLSNDVSAVVTAVDSNSLALRLGNAVLGRIVPRHPPAWWPLLGSFATRSGVVYRRDVLLSQPFPDPAFPGSDIAHLLSLRRRGRIAFERRARVFYNVHQGATSSQGRDYTLYKDALKHFDPATRFTHTADLVARRIGQMLSRS
ncbi:MAG TPA: glycosyltransferase family A protein [Luteimonas sp.]|nr:glycosyltransferase family A protein [Luteimonas sp.]